MTVIVMPQLSCALHKSKLKKQIIIVKWNSFNLQYGLNNVLYDFGQICITNYMQHFRFVFLLYTWLAIFDALKFRQKWLPGKIQNGICTLWLRVKNDVLTAICKINVAITSYILQKFSAKKDKLEIISITYL